MKKNCLSLAISFLCMLSFVASLGAAEKKPASAAKKIIVTPNELQWKQGPAAVPEAKMAVLEGDPKQKGFFVMRIKLPAGSKIPLHVHENVERVTVISGKINLAMGDRAENPTELPAGSYFSLAPNIPHNVSVAEETVLQIATFGPWTFKPLKKGAQ